MSTKTPKSAKDISDQAYSLGYAHATDAIDAIESAACLMADNEGLAALAQGSPEGFKSVRADWCEGYVAVAGCAMKTAENRFAIVYKASGLIKPRSAEAVRKAQTRAARATKVAKAPKKGTDAAAEAKARIVLTPHEAHVVWLMRAHKWDKLTEFLAEISSLENADAPRIRDEVIAAV